MKHILTRIAPLVLTVAVSACGSDADGPSASATASQTAPSSVPTSGPAAASCTASVAGLPVTVPGAGGRFSLSVTTGAGCSWSVQSDADWASVNPGTGVGSGTTMMTVAENTEVADTRSANLIISGQAVRFWQATACTYTLSQTAADVAGDGSTVGVTLTTKDQCPWTVTASETWLSPRPTSGSGTDTIRIDVAANTGDIRHGFVTIAGKRVQITQQAR